MGQLTELDILKIAISIEEDGAKFYNEMCAETENDTEKQKIFQVLMDEEKSHATIFRKIYKEIKAKGAQEYNYPIFERHVPRVVRSLVDYFVIPNKSNFMIKNQDFREIINEAVDQEYRTIEFYSKLAHHSKNESIKKRLYDIIREEERHVIKLKEMIYFRATNISIEEHIHFVENILDGMKDWVRVIDLDDNIIYANRAMKEALGYYVIGRKCFEVIGRSEPCDNCVSKQAIDAYGAMHKEEEINEQIYSVMSSPLRDLEGEANAVVEVLRDVTQAKTMEIEIKAQNDKLNHDLHIARTMQYRVLPQNLNDDRIVSVYKYIPCEMIGGDFFDIFYIDPSHIGLYIADVSGHGVSASLLTMFLRQSINKEERLPSRVLKELYAKYNEANFQEETYITMFYAVIDLDNSTITYANAGHHTIPLVFNENDEEIVHLCATGIPISSWVKETEYTDYVKQLKLEDKILFLTDGVTESINEDGEIYGDKRLQEFIASNKNKSINELKDLLIKNLHEFKSDEIQSDKGFEDDLTVLFLHMKS